MGAIHLLRNGGQMIRDVEDVLENVQKLIEENTTLKHIIEAQGSVQIKLLDEMGVLSRKLDSIRDDVMTEVKAIGGNIAETAETRMIGKKLKITEGVASEVSEMTYKDIRKNIKRACKYQKELYDELYARLFQVTGVDVYEVGKTKLNKKDTPFNVKETNKTYLNTVFREGVHKEAAAIALDMMR